MPDWSDTPTITIFAPQCPHCAALRPIIVRSEANGDGTVTRKATCRTCSKRFKIIVETLLPEFGNPDFPLANIDEN
jgi:hypothetical protein